MYLNALSCKSTTVTVMVYWSVRGDGVDILLHIIADISINIICAPNVTSALSHWRGVWVQLHFGGKKKKKLFGVQIDPEPDRRSWNRWCLGCLVSFMMFLALHSQQVPVKMMSAQWQRRPVLSARHGGGHFCQLWCSRCLWGICRCWRPPSSTGWIYLTTGENCEPKLVQLS